jgi:hypothetical protein
MAVGDLDFMTKKQNIQNMNKIRTATHDETFKSNKRRGCMKDLTEQGHGLLITR